ncbi:hypothetical protein BC629DRAFT_1732110 [Irpex lacteus]|nr:hypothetical protein BC629DRAFT_1732110 [Irpex lacteus]
MKGSQRDFLYTHKIWGTCLTEEQAIVLMPKPDPVAGWVPMSEWLFVREDVEHFVGVRSVYLSSVVIVLISHRLAAIYSVIIRVFNTQERDLKAFCASYNIDLISYAYPPSKTLVYCMACSKLCLNTRSFLIDHCNEPFHLKALYETHPDKEQWPAAELGPSDRVPVSREFEEEKRKREATSRPGEDELWMEMEVAGALETYEVRGGVAEQRGRDVVGRSNESELWMNGAGRGLEGGTTKRIMKDTDMLTAAIKRIQLK